MRNKVVAALVLATAFVVGVAISRPASVQAQPDPVNAEKLDAELRAAGLPVDGCDSRGKVAWRANATDADRQRAAEILAAHDPAPTREQRLRRAGLGPDDFLALKAAPTEWARLTAEERAWVDATLEAWARKARVVIQSP